MINLDWIGSRHEELPIIRVWPEWYSTGLWNPPSLVSRAVGPNLTFEEGELPSDFGRDLESWQDVFNDHPPESERTAEQNEWLLAQGIDLAIRLSQELGDRAWVQSEYEYLALTFRNGRCVGSPSLV